MKKIVALLLALAMTFALVACGAKEEEPTTTTDLFADISGDTTEAANPADETTVAPDETNAVSDPTAVSEEASAASEETTAEGETTAASEETTTEASKGLNSTDPAEIAAYYNAAVKATYEFPKDATEKMALKGDITGDGAIGAILKVLSPAAVKALEKNSGTKRGVPAREYDLLASDIVKATAKSENGKTYLVIQLKEQKDGPNASGKGDGPVARGVGTLGNIDSALAELGAEITEGRDTVSLTYKDAYIKCTVDESTGKIVAGEWHYDVHVLVGDAKAKLGISANLKNLKAVVSYTVTY